MDKDTDNKDCMERQLTKLDQKANRYSAVVFPEECTSGLAPQTCLKEKGFGDCFDKGIVEEAITAHKATGNVMNYNVVANWCSHKRLFESLEEKKGESDFFLVLEDNVLLDRNHTISVLKDFVQGYEDQSWDLLQIDPFGAKSFAGLHGHYKGKPVWHPHKAEHDQCGKYWGFHAVLLRSSGLSNILTWMRNQKAMPIDRVATRMPKVAAFGGLIARNPVEAVSFGKHFAVPDVCTSSIEAIRSAARDAANSGPDAVGDEREAEIESPRKSKEESLVEKMEKKPAALLELSSSTDKMESMSAVNVEQMQKQHKERLQVATTRLKKLQDADTKMAAYMHALWAQAAFHTNKEFHQELKEVESYVRESGEQIAKAQEAVSLLETQVGFDELPQTAEALEAAAENTASVSVDALSDAEADSIDHAHHSSSMLQMEDSSEEYDDRVHNYDPDDQVHLDHEHMAEDGMDESDYEKLQEGTLV